MSRDDSTFQGGGTGLGDMNTPTSKKKRDDIDSATQRVAAAQSSSTGSSLLGGGTDYFGRPLGGGSQGSFPSAAPRPLNPKNPNLWMGSESPIAFMDYSDAISMYHMWDDKVRNKFLSRLNLAGYDTSSMKDSEIAKAWADYVTQAGQYQVAGKHLSPWDVLGKDIAQREAAKPKTVTATQKSYNISTAEDAAALFQGAAQTLLGRDPTKAEQARFKSILNKYEAAHPATTTTTTTYAGGEMTGQTSTSEGGVSAGAQQYIAQEEAKKNPEYGAYQAATNGMNWLMEMLGG